MGEKWKVYNNVRAQLGDSTVDMEGAVQFLNTQAELIDTMRDRISSQSSEIAGLRKLIGDMAEYAGKSDLQEIIQEAESKISELDADELKGLQLMRRVQAVISNPSEIPNSSEVSR